MCGEYLKKRTKINTLLRYNPVEYGFIILAQKLIVMKRQIVSMQNEGGAIGKGGDTPGKETAVLWNV